MITILHIALIASIAVGVLAILLAMLLARINQERHYLESAQAVREREQLEEKRSTDAAR